VLNASPKPFASFSTEVEPEALIAPLRATVLLEAAAEEEDLDVAAEEADVEEAAEVEEDEAATDVEDTADDEALDVAAEDDAAAEEDEDVLLGVQPANIPAVKTAAPNNATNFLIINYSPIPCFKFIFRIPNSRCM